jgi:two-component system OmpR family sensor kinase
VHSERGHIVSLRFRITLLTAVLIAFTSTIIGFATYLSVSSVQLDQVDATLKASLANVDISPGGLPNDFRAAEREQRARRDNLLRPVAFAGINSRGVITDVRLSGLPQDPDPFPTIPASVLTSGSKTIVSFVDPETTESYRLASRSLRRGGTVIALTSLFDYQNSLNSIAWRTTVIVLFSTLGGAIIAWFTVRRSFRPVNKMVRTAGEIAAGATNQRMPEGAPGTELGVLSDSMNSMVDSLTLSMEQLEQSENRLRTFVSDASHEIRTPLTVIRGYIELLVSNDGNLPHSRSDLDVRALSRINSESLRLERLVTSLLALDLAETSTTSLEEFSLTSLINDSFGDLAQLSERPVELDLQDVSMTGTEEGWAQLLANLAQNISRYTPTDAPVAVRLRHTDKSGESWFTLTVDDGGPGIPIHNRETIFDRFTRLDKARDSASGGFGLGMSIIKSVVIAHQGELALDDSPLGGLRVEISAPTRPRQP